MNGFFSVASASSGSTSIQSGGTPGCDAPTTYSRRDLHGYQSETKVHASSQKMGVALVIQSRFNPNRLQTVLQGVFARV
jgi:hypothetical protein